MGGNCQLPGVPTGLTATTSPGSVRLQWLSGAGSAPTGHGLLVGSAPGAANLGTFPIGPATTFMAPAPNGTYYVRVFATSSCGNSAPSSEISFTIGTPTILVPAGIYDGQVFNHVQRFAGRGPIRSFVLQLNQPVPTTATFSLCRRSGPIISDAVRHWEFLAGRLLSDQSFPSSNCCVTTAIFRCSIRSQSGNTYDGLCPLGGANCSFRMTRR